MARHSGRRKYPRIPIDLTVFLRRVDERAVGPRDQGAMRDISQDGLSFHSPVPVPVGSSVELDLQLPDGLVSIFGFARWCTKTAPVVVELEIVRIPEFERPRLDRYLDQVLTEEREATIDAPPVMEDLGAVVGIERILVAGIVLAALAAVSLYLAGL